MAIQKCYHQTVNIITMIYKKIDYHNSLSKNNQHSKALIIEAQVCGDRILVIVLIAYINNVIYAIMGFHDYIGRYEFTIPTSIEITNFSQ
jgi:hypothetical protein